MTTENYVHVSLKDITFKNFSKQSLWFRSPNGNTFNLPKSQVLSICSVEDGDVETESLKAGTLMDSVEIPSWLADIKKMVVIDQGESVQ